MSFVFYNNNKKDEVLFSFLIFNHKKIGWKIEL